MLTDAGNATKRPDAPPDLDGEALLEWGRVCDELEANGLLDRADRAVLTIYCQTWQTYQSAMRGVAMHGAIVKHHNGVPGASPYYKVATETGARLERLLAQLGMTPAARHKIKPDDPSQGKLEF